MKFRYTINEAGLTVGDAIYPKNNNVLILAGGAGSGKGFVTDKIIFFEGKKFDVDELKLGFLKFKDDKKYQKMFDEFIDTIDPSQKKAYETVQQFVKEGRKGLDELNLKNTLHTSVLHFFVAWTGLDVKRKNLFFLNASGLRNKPNVIFDVTLKSLNDLTEIYNFCKLGGYQPENVHLVWILNDINVAREQNEKRSRSVSDKILSDTHQGASKTMHIVYDWFNMTLPNLDNVRISDLIKGDVWIVPNNAKADDSYVIVHKDENPDENKGMMDRIGLSNKYKGTTLYLKCFNKFKLKNRLGKMKTLDDIAKEGYYLFSKTDDGIKYTLTTDKKYIQDKIDKYTPDAKDKERWN